MENLTKPQLISGPFAYNGQKNEIPDAATGNAHASIEEGFPPMTMIPLDQGGEAPYGQDFNGLGNLLSQFYFYTQNGGMYTFEQEVSDKIGGYPLNAVLWYFPTGGSPKWLRSTKSNNTDNFVTDPSFIGTSWVESAVNASVGAVGDIIYSCRTSAPAGTSFCDGSTFSKDRYPKVWELLTEGGLYNISATEYQENINKNGYCEYFGVDTEAGTFRVPTITTGYFINGEGESSSLVRSQEEELVWEQTTPGDYTVVLPSDGVYKITAVGGAGAAYMYGRYDDRGYIATGGSGAAFKGIFNLKGGSYQAVVGKIVNNVTAQTSNTQVSPPTDNTVYDTSFEGVLTVGGGGTATSYSSTGIGAAGIRAVLSTPATTILLDQAGKPGTYVSGGKGGGAGAVANGGASVLGGYGKGQGGCTSEYASRRYWINGTNGYIRVDKINSLIKAVVVLATEFKEISSADYTDQIEADTNAALEEINTAKTVAVSDIDIHGQEIVENMPVLRVNNPLTFGMYKWWEFEPANASWLISNGNYHSGEIYDSFYQWLLNNYLGVEITKGISVKANTQSLTDYDFVINEADKSFRLPLKVRGASGSAVAGNGMTTGWTNVSNNFGVSGFYGSGGSQNVNAYGTSIGTGNLVATNTTVNTTIGLTLDPAKSGIELSPRGMNLYFYVGDTIKNAELIDANNVLSQLANKANKAKWDYSAQIALPGAAISTLPEDGFVIFNVDSSEAPRVNGELFPVYGNDAQNEGSVTLLVNKGYTVYIPKGAFNAKFIPYI